MMPIAKISKAMLSAIALAILIGGGWLTGLARAEAAPHWPVSLLQVDAPPAGQPPAAEGQTTPAATATPTPTPGQRLAEAQSRHTLLIVGAIIPVSVIIVAVALCYRRKVRGH